MNPRDNTSAEPPDIGSWLESYLAVRRSEYEEQYRGAANSDEQALYKALDAIERRAESLVTTGVIPPPLADELSAYMPGDSLETKVRDLLRYTIVHHRLEFDVAEGVCARLKDLDKRVGTIVALNMILLGYRPSATALKYFQRATTLFLAGYETESIIMCGAVLEASLRERFADDLLRADGMLPVFRRANDYSVSQRLKYERRHPIFEDSHRQLVGDLLNSRNDAVHVQPDISTKALRAVISLTILLPIILPAD